MVAYNCTALSRIARILGRKWTLELLCHLHERQRFCTLQAMLAGISPAMLSERLKSLEEEGIICRYPMAEMPPRVEYELTEKGRDLAPVLGAMMGWVQRWHPETFQGIDNHKRSESC